MSDFSPDKAHNVFELKFPDDLYGVVIADIDLAMLSSDSLRLIDAYTKQGGDLSEIQWQVFAQCDCELQQILPHVSIEHRKYFLVIHDAIKQVLKHR